MNNRFKEHFVDLMHNAPIRYLLLKNVPNSILLTSSSSIFGILIENEIAQTIF